MQPATDVMNIHLQKYLFFPSACFFSSLFLIIKMFHVRKQVMYEYTVFNNSTQKETYTEEAASWLSIIFLNCKSILQFLNTYWNNGIEILSKFWKTIIVNLEKKTTLHLQIMLLTIDYMLHIFNFLLEDFWKNHNLCI